MNPEHVCLIFKHFSNPLQHIFVVFSILAFTKYESNGTYSKCSSDVYRGRRCLSDGFLPNASVLDHTDCSWKNV